MMGRIIWRVTSRTIGFALAGAIIMGFAGLVEGASIGAVMGLFVTAPGTPMIVPSGVIIVHTG